MVQPRCILFQRMSPWNFGPFPHCRLPDPVTDCLSGTALTLDNHVCLICIVFFIMFCVAGIDSISNFAFYTFTLTFLIGIDIDILFSYAFIACLFIEGAGFKSLYSYCLFILLACTFCFCRVPTVDVRASAWSLFLFSLLCWSFGTNWRARGRYCGCDGGSAGPRQRITVPGPFAVA